jgi:hypothetical protein
MQLPAGNGRIYIYMVLAVVSVFLFCALRAQKRNTKEDEVPHNHLFALFPRVARKKRKPREIRYRSAEGQKTPTA